MNNNVEQLEATSYKFDIPKLVKYQTSLKPVEEDSEAKSSFLLTFLNITQNCSATRAFYIGQLFSEPNSYETYKTRNMGLEKGLLLLRDCLFSFPNLMGDYNFWKI